MGVLGLLQLRVVVYVDDFRTLHFHLVENVLFLLVYGYFEKGCREKCTRQS